MLCAAIDIGSNTTRVLVAEPIDGQLKKVMEQRAYTRISKAVDADGAIAAEKVDEVGELVATQVRLAQELGAIEIRAARPTIVDGGDEERIIIARAKSVVAKNARAARRHELDELLGIATVIVIAHRDDDAVFRAELTDDVRDVFVKCISIRHHVAGDDGEIALERVRGVRPAHAPTPRRK